ncbi:MAG: regulatory protein RecX [Armatimonadota bacterium]
MMDKQRPETAIPDPELERAMQYALRVLGYRARSEKEMRQKLQRKGFSALVTDRTLMQLTRLELLDDREFTRSWVTNRTGYGPVRLKYELRQKGIDADLAEESITALRSEDDDFATAWRLARKAQRDNAVRDRAALLRLRQMLLRRGFTRDIINRVCARLDEQSCSEG